MNETPHLSLPFILGAQAQKHVTHNEALRSLDTVVQLSVLDRSLATPPASPAEGARYIVAAAPTGAWTGQANKVASFQDGEWVFYAPREGWITWVADEDIAMAWTGTAWTRISTGGAGSFTTLGVNATADSTNRLAVASAASLFNHGGAGHQLKLNKNAANDTVSLLFQTGFSGRAEWGLNGSDDVSLKVSADGASFADVFTVARATGQATFSKGVEQVQADTFTASGIWSKPAWAKWVEGVRVGGGGGGGGGRRGAGSTTRIGGGGGAAGGLCRETFLASELPTTMSVDIGAGGAGGAGVTTDNTDGNAAAPGGTTTFRDGSTTWLEAHGGTGGAGGTAVDGAAAASVIGTQGAANPGGAAIGATPAAPVASGIALSPGGGGAGSGVTAGNALGFGASGGAGYRAGGASRQAAGGAGATTNGTPGGAGTDRAWSRGTGGGGGGGRGSGGGGGAGGTPGGGGGGSSGHANGSSTASGGNGARGEAWIIARG
ncbi:MAG: DUF2793 domain-containing protein [Hyphomicrobium sp.]